MARRKRHSRRLPLAASPSTRLGTANATADPDVMDIDSAPTASQVTPIRERMAVGVDFGTTYSGAAYCHSSNRERGLDKIEVICRYPCQRNQTDEKVPSEISYDSKNENPQWGHEASSTARASSTSSSAPNSIKRSFTESFRAAGERRIFGRFKLLLDSETGDDVESGDYGRLFDPGNDLARIGLPEGKTALDVTADYLECFHTFLIKQLQNTMATTYDSTPIDFVITTPAIWKHQAQAATKRACMVAGFADRPIDTITMVSEPEAAALYAITELSTTSTTVLSVNVGDTFVVCDAGGGTVDLITYSVLQTSPELKLKEVVIGDGAKCGSSTIDERFHNMLRGKIGPSFDDPKIWTPKHKGRGSKVMQDFDVAKRAFGAGGLVGPWSIIMLPDGIKDNEAEKIKDSELWLDDKDMRFLFTPVVKMVIKLVENQVRESRRAGYNPKDIILVGGFGQSPYLSSRLKEWSETQSPPLSILNPQRSWSAVIRGAVLQGLKPNRGTRKLRMHYGVVGGIEFDKHIHNYPGYEEDLYYHPYRLPGKDVYIWNHVTWCVEKGQDVDEEGTGVKFKRKMYVPFPYESPEDLKGFSLAIVACKDDDKPSYANDPKIERLGTLKFDLTNVPKRKMQPTQGGRMYQCGYYLHMALKSAEIEFTVIAEGVMAGKYQLSYD